ncbi:MAG: DnaB-like helicase C-terminal domain-containing protein [bacterium]
MNENTLTAYLGPEFQQSLMWQLLVEPDFAEKTIPKLAIEYFDDPNMKRLFVIILEYYKEYEKVPNLQNQSISQAINEFKTPNNPIEEETLFSVIKRIELWNERVLNKDLLYNGDVIQKQTQDFIKQQEYRKLGEFIITKTKKGEIKKKDVIAEIEDKFKHIGEIGDEEDYGTEVIENVENVLTKEFRKTIPTGVHVIDTLTGGGLGKGEIGVILTPSGVGKTTLLTKISNTAYDEGKKVLQIIFEDTPDQVKRKHYTIWSGVPLSKIDDNREIVGERVNEKITELEKNNGKLVIKRFSQENTTIRDIRNWIDRYEKKFGFKFELVVLDYLDCVEPHKRTPDRNEAELVVIKSFEALASDLDIPAWSAIQSNRTGFDSEFVEAHQSGGSIKRIQKAHFFMSVAKTPEQKEAHLANIRIIKARFAQDGQTFKDCIYNNDTLEIRIEDTRYNNTKAVRNLKQYGEDDINKIENMSNSYINTNNNDDLLKSYLDKINNEKINEKEDVKDDESQEHNNENNVGDVDEIPTNDVVEKHTSTDSDDKNQEDNIQNVQDAYNNIDDLNDIEKMLDDPDENKNEVFDYLNKQRKNQDNKDNNKK